jgi:hypothetical protein
MSLSNGTVFSANLDNRFNLGGGVGPPGPPGPPGSFINVDYRLNVDPTSNVGPLGGLLVAAASTNPGPFNVPLTDSQAVGIASAFNDDTSSVCTFLGDRIRFNNSGIFNFSFQFPLLSIAIITDVAMQLLRTGDSIFAGPPICDAFCRVDVDVSGSPVGGIYDYTCTLAASAIAEITAGDEISLVFYMDSGTVELPLTSCVSISIAQSSGPVGPAGPPGPSPAAMTPIVLGTAYGFQEIANSPLNNNCLGYQVNASDGSISIYNDETGIAQNAFNKDSSISIINSCNPDIASLLNGSVHLLNNVGFTNPPTIASGSIILASNARYDTQINSDGCIAIGTGGTGSVIDLNLAGCAITNGLAAETLAPSEFCASSFSSFRLRSLPAPTGSHNIVTYDPITSYIYDSGIVVGGGLAQPTVAGYVYGDATPTTKLQLGYNSNLTPTTGVNIYASSVSAAQGAYSDFDVPIYISSNSDATGQDVGYISIHNSTNLVHGLGFSISLLTGTPGFTADNSGAVVISALASSFTDGGVSRTNFIAMSPGFGVGPVQVANNAIILTNANVAHTCVTDEFYVGLVNKWVVDGTIPTAATAASNLFVRRDPATGEVTNGPLAPLLATLDENDQILTRDSVSGLVSYNSAAKRTFNYQGTTDGAGQITQSLAALALTVNPRCTATVINNSVVVFYGVQINAISTAAVTLQVFNSVTNPGVGTTMIPAGAGIVVDIVITF